MSGAAIVVTMLVAGAFHAGWNLAAKQVRTDRILFLVGVGTVTALDRPGSARSSPSGSPSSSSRSGPPRSVWPA